VKHLGALRCMVYLGVELRTVYPARIVADRSNDVVLTARQHSETLRQSLDPVTVAHPHRERVRKIREQGGDGIDHTHMRRTVLPLRTRDDFPAHAAGQSLHAIAYPEYGNLSIQQIIGQRGGVLIVNTVRPPRQDEAFGGQIGYTRRVRVPGQNLRIDVLLTHTPSDQLRSL